MKASHWLSAFAIGLMPFGLSALPSKAAIAVVTPSAFDLACPLGSGFSQVSGPVWEFANYLANAPDGTCYMGNLGFRDFGDLVFLMEMNGRIGISQGLLSVSSSAAATAPVQLATSFYAFSGSILPGTTLNYKVFGQTNGESEFQGFNQWTARSQGSGQYSVVTTSSPSYDPDCQPSVVTNPSSPQGPPCDVPDGTLVSTFDMTNEVVDDWMTQDSMGGGPSIENTFISTATLPQEGTSSLNPWMPPVIPSRDDEPWIFPPTVVDNPDRIWWYDPEVAIGYVYNVADPLGPLFDQYVAPDLPYNDTYELLSSGGSACSTNPEDFTTVLDTITQNVPYTFTTPLACFAIKGISEQNALDPLNTSAFVGGISFNKTGTVTVSQTPIPTPGPLPLAGAGMAYGWARRLRRRLLSREGSTLH